jgi:hypothetical protein
LEAPVVAAVVAVVVEAVAAARHLALLLQFHAEVK